MNFAFHFGPFFYFLFGLLGKMVKLQDVPTFHFIYFRILSVYNKKISQHFPFLYRQQTTGTH